MKQTKQKEKKPAAEKMDALRLVKPRHKWAVDGYERYPTIRFVLPWQFLYMCKLTNVEPAKVLKQFMVDVSGESWDRNKDATVRSTAVDYFIKCGYGNAFYTEEELRQMFQEVDTIGGLWPLSNSPKLMEEHGKWHDKYLYHWFKKWYNKVRRKGA